MIYLLAYICRLLSSRCQGNSCVNTNWALFVYFRFARRSRRNTRYGSSELESLLWRRLNSTIFISRRWTFIKNGGFYSVLCSFELNIDAGKYLKKIIPKANYVFFLIW